MTLARLLRRPRRFAVRARVSDDPGVVATRVAAAFRPPYGATVPGGPPVDPPVWRVVGGGDASRLVLSAASQFGPPGLPIRIVKPVWTRLVFEGEVSADGRGSVLAGWIAVRTPWWAAALLLAGTLLLGAFAPLLLALSVPVPAGAFVGAAAGVLAVRQDQERALHVAPVLGRAIREAAAGARPPAPPVPSWGPRDAAAGERP